MCLKLLGDFSWTLIDPTTPRKNRNVGLWIQKVLVNITWVNHVVAWSLNALGIPPVF
jgi:hypothetical protein